MPFVVWHNSHPQQSQHLHHSSVHGGRGWNNASTTNFLIIQLMKSDHLKNLQAQIDQTDQEVEFSIVHNPILKQTWTARKGQGAFCNGKRIKVLVSGTHCLVWETAVNKLLTIITIINQKSLFLSFRFLRFIKFLLQKYQMIR